MFATVGELLVRRAEEHPAKTALIWEEAAHTYADLLRLSLRYRDALRERGATGKHVAIVLDNGLPFLAAFFGASLCGAVPVPVSPRSSLERLSYIVEDCGAAAVIVAAGEAEERGALGRASFAHFDRYLEAFESVPEVSPAVVDGVGDAAVPAFVQYTSGSTGHSKGVVISHRAVLENIRAFSIAMDIDPARDVFSSLMPLFHDMGLVCFGLAPIYHAVPLALYRQEALSLYRWLEGIASHRVTVTGGPNTLLRLANRVVDRPQDHDLSSLRVLVCGSEPVLADTVRQFENLFAVPGRVKPAYGMAELTLCATMTPAGEPFRVDADGVVSCGRPIDGVRIEVRGDDGPTPAPPGSRGELLIASAAVMDGYLGKPEETQAVLRDGCLASGDLGYVDDQGYVYILGRTKNLIVRGGEKYSPHDVEALGLRHPEVRNCAVVSIAGSGGDAIVVAVLEVAKQTLGDPGVLRRLATDIRAEALRQVRFSPDRFAFVLPGSIPLTENGKTRHEALRSLWTSGKLPSGAVFFEPELASARLPVRGAA